MYVKLLKGMVEGRRSESSSKIQAPGIYFSKASLRTSEGTTRCWSRGTAQGAAHPVLPQSAVSLNEIFH